MLFIISVQKFKEQEAEMKWLLLVFNERIVHKHSAILFSSVRLSVRL